MNSEAHHVPSREPWLSSWCRLHTLHLIALSHLDQPAVLRYALNLADAKFRIYLGSIGASGGATP